jgi:hypothetical protein
MTKYNQKNRIGYRYLFDSKGCSLSNHEEVKIKLIVSEEYDVQLYFGPKPQFKIDSVVGCSKYYVPGTKTPLGRCVINGKPSQFPEYGPLFLEIVIRTEADMKEGGNVITHDILLRQAESKKDEFKNIVNLVAGIIGLRLHRQFVLELINKNALVWEGEESHKGGFATPGVEILKKVALTDNGIKHIKAVGDKLKTLPHEDMEEYSLIFHWLLRAWNERDILYKFINLFILLECILNMLSDTKINIDDKRKAKSIRMAIRKHTGELKRTSSFFQ